MTQKANATRGNEEWIADLTGNNREQALSDLRTILVRGLGAALSDKNNVAEIFNLSRLS